MTLRVTVDDDFLTRYAQALHAVRAFADGSGADRALVLLDRGEDSPPLIVESVPGGPVEVQDGPSEFTIANEQLSGPAGPALPFKLYRAAPASSVHVHPETGEISAPLGAVAAMADAVRALADVFAGRSVATAEFPTHDPDRPLTIAAREGEPTVVAIGDQHFELP